MRHIWLSCIIVGLALAACAVTGWRVDGSGVVPEANPPLQWDEASGKGIRWKTLMPNWSQSSPIVLEDAAGKPRVFVMSEPTDWAPVLLCVDGDTGAVLWQREVDHLALLPAADAAKARETWSMVLKREREKARLRAEKESLARALAKTPDDAALQAASAALDARAEALKVNMVKGRTEWQLEDKDTEHRGRVRHCQGAWGLTFSDPWALGREYRPLTWVGFGYPTPVSDGTHVYVWTGYNSVAKYDLEGNLAWIVRLPPVRYPDSHFISNPVLADGKLVLADAAYSAVYALDAATGRIAWQDTIGQNTMHSPHTPHVVRVADVAYLFHPAGRVYRIADGKLMSQGLGAMGKGPGAPVTDGPRFYYNVGGDGTLARAVELQVDGDGLKAVTLWEKPRLFVSPRGNEGVCYKGRIYAGEQIIDAATGAVVGKLPFPVAQPSGGRGWLKRPNGIPFTVVADRYLFTGGEGGHYFNAQGTFWVFDLTTGKLVATNRLAFAPVDAAREAFIRGESATDRWDTWGNSATFFYKDRIYIRSLDYLYCLGEGVGAG